MQSEAAEIYDSFPLEARDMSKAEFCRRFTAATDQESMQSDLARIVNGKREKGIIDRAVGGQN
jgi:hypothetical protein